MPFGSPLHSFKVAMQTVAATHALIVRLLRQSDAFTHAVLDVFRRRMERIANIG